MAKKKSPVVGIMRPFGGETDSLGKAYRLNRPVTELRSISARMQPSDMPAARS